MTETREPVTVGETLDQVVGQLYHDQMLKQYWQADEQVTLNALVMLCLAARRFDERVKYILLDDSDQGEWQTVAGLAAGLPTYPGEFADVLDLDAEDQFEDEGWAASVGDRTKHAWEPFVKGPSEVLPAWRLLDVDKVLAEVHLPWRPVTQVTEKFTDLPEGFHDSRAERIANTVGDTEKGGA